MLLAGDVGGTKTQLALYKFAGPLRAQKLKTYPTKAFRGLGSLIKTYLRDTGAQVEAACLAIAGPVLRGQVHMVNVGWKLSERRLAQALGLPQVKFLNDLEAMAFAVPHLAPKYLFTLKPGKRDPKGNIGVIAAGTGLGQALLIRRGVSIPVPVPTESGHAELPVTDATEWALYQWLKARFSHVSIERALSGPGLENIYAFLLEQSQGQGPRLSAPEISQAAQEGQALAQKALEMFVRFYGREAGNLALRSLATGGIFLGGGIAPKILSFLEKGPFVEAFLDKGRLSDFVQEVPVYVILHQSPVLLGAAVYGTLHLRPEAPQSLL